MKKPVKSILLGFYALSFIMTAALLVWIYAGDPPPVCITLTKFFFALWLVCFLLLEIYLVRKTPIHRKKAAEKSDQPLKCKFCEQLKSRDYLTPARNRMDTDNLCQCLSWGRIDGSVETGPWATIYCPEDCGGCADDNEYFGLFTYENRMGFSYHFKSQNLRIDRNSQMLTINFCPWCGKPLSEEIVPFEKSCINFEMGSVMIEK